MICPKAIKKQIFTRVRRREETREVDKRRGEEEEMGARHREGVSGKEERNGS